MDIKRLIAIVDDDPSVLDSLSLLLGATGYETRCFARAGDLLDELTLGKPIGCIISDVRMPSISGLELLNAISALSNRPPIILISGHGDIAMATAAIKAGAYDFIEKPYKGEQLIGSINGALSEAKQRHAAVVELEQLAARIAGLTPRQRQVMDLAVQGRTNKEIAVELGVSPRTVESYRDWVMERTGAKTFAELVRIAIRLEAN